MAAAVAVEAGALVVLNLVELQEPGALAGGHRQPQLVLTVGEQEPRRGHAQEVDTALHEHVEQVERIEVVAQAVGKFDKRLR